ncbi:MAG: polysaccharide deacetylase family protein [Paludibacter sp.]
MNIRFPDFFRPFFGKLVWRKDASSKVIYLTFDDGPVPEVTSQVLDILDQFNIKGTFFCVGDNVRKYPEVYARIVESGHKPGNHTFNHIKGFSVKVDEYVDNALKALAYINSNLFRPPYGRITRKQKQKLESRFEIIMWDLLTHDYNKRLSPEKILQNIKRFSRNGSIVVFHDSVKASDNILSVLPAAIEFWRSEGYEFATL